MDTRKPPSKPISPESWEEWVTHPVTKRVLRALKVRSELIQQEWTRAYWAPETGSTPDPSELSYLKGKAQMAAELSGLSLTGVQLLESVDPNNLSTPLKS